MLYTGNLNRSLIVVVGSCCWWSAPSVLAQEADGRTEAAATTDAAGAGETIDSSKPTNFYSLLENNFEASWRKERGNLYGYRANLTMALSEANLVLVEVPVLYNTESKEFLPGDLRGRYFFLPYKNYDNFFGAFGPSIDVFAPTGDYTTGHGNARWIVSPGLTAGLMIADWIQAFPIISYQYSSEFVDDRVTEAELPRELRDELHGITAQVVVPIVASEALFFQVTPIVAWGDLSDSGSVAYSQELLGVYSLTPTLQVSAFYRGDFKVKTHTTRLGLTVFL